MAPGSTQHDIYTTPFKDGAFLFHRSFFSTYQRLDKEQARDYINAILAYAFSGVKPDEYNPVWENGLDTVFLNMDIDAGREPQ
jgi:hypothetical protein